MTKKKNKKNNNIPRDFTINDCANAPIPVKAIRKSATVAKPEMEASWEDISDDVDNSDDVDISEDDTKLAHQKKESNAPKRPEGEYPEIVYYLLSRYIKPEDIGTFAGINKSTYAITKSKAFWTLQYNRYCEDAPQLPQRFRSESLKAYGLRQTVIRALFYTYEKFSRRMVQRNTHPSCLLNWVCVNMWFNRGLTYWNVYFKMKKPQIHGTPKRVPKDAIEEMGRVDANPEEGAQVLMVICKSFDQIPPLTGLTLSTVKLVLSQGYRHHTLHLGFNRACYNVQSIVPECLIILDAVVKVCVSKWWHPQYPHSSNFIPRQDGPTLLVNEFFDDHENS